MSKKPTQTKTKTTVEPEVNTQVPAVTVGTNSNKIDWPQDRNASCAELRRGGVRAIGRIGGTEDNLKRVLDTLDLLGEYAVARCAEQRVEAEAKRKAGRDLIARQKAANAERLQSEIKRRSDALKAGKADLARLKKQADA